MMTFFIRLPVCAVLLSLLSGCFQVLLTGPVGGATVTLARAHYPDNILQTVTSKTEADLIAELGAESWEEMGPSTRLLFLGTAEFDTADLGDETLYLVTASGGVDYDYDANRVPDPVPTPVTGSWRSIMTGAQLKTSLAKVSLLTEALYRVADGRSGGVESLIAEDTSELLDFGAVQVVPDLNRDGVENYDDVLAWNSTYNRDSYLGDLAALDEFADAIATESFADIAWITNQLLQVRRYENILKENPDLLVCGRRADHYVFTHEIAELDCASDGYLETGGSLEGIESFPQLHTLILREPAFLDYSALLNLKRLHTLEISTDRMTPGVVPGGDALSVLGQLSSLRRLKLPVSPLDRYDWLAGLEQVDAIDWAIPGGDFDAVLDALATMSGLSELIIEAGSLSSAQLNRLQELEGLRRLTLGPNYLQFDLGDLPVLSELEALTVLGNADSAAHLQSFSSLQYLDLSGGSIRDVSPLWALTGLEYLNLNGNPVEDWSGISALSSLQTLDVQFTPLSSLADFHGLGALLELDISYTAVSDLAGVEHLQNLRYLDVEATQVTNLEPAASLPLLEELDASRIGLTSTGIAHAASLERLDLGNNQLTTSQDIHDLPRLKYLDLSGNALVAIPGLDQLPSVQVIELHDNKGIPCAELFALRDTLAGRAGAYTADCTP